MGSRAGFVRLAHFAFVLTFFAVFPIAPWWVLIAMGFTYSVSISWNINGISHNFLHNPYFKSHALNRVFSLVESLAWAFPRPSTNTSTSGTTWGNSDRPDEAGETIDWLSIYRHGHDGEARISGATFSSATSGTIRKSSTARSPGASPPTPSGASSRSRPF